MVRLRSLLAPGKTTRWLVALAAVALLGASTTAQAAPVQFGGYTQTSVGSPISFNTTTGTVSGSSQVSFSFSNLGVLSPAALNSPIDATMTIALYTTQPVFVGGGILYGAYDSAVLTITANTAIAGQTNLLTVNVNNIGSILATTGSVTPSYSGTGTQADIVYNSAFLNFNPTYTGSINIGFILQSALTKNGGTGFFNTNTATSGGQFSAEPLPSVPEPASIALVGLGLIAAPIVLRRRKTAVVNV